MIRGTFAGAFEPRREVIPRRNRQQMAESVQPDTRPMCTHCGLNPQRAKGQCSTCLRYESVNGTARPAHVIKAAIRRRDEIRWCADCKSTEIKCAGYCNACYLYRFQHGKARPRWRWDKEFCCLTCGIPKSAASMRKDGYSTFYGGRCRACNLYKHRTGQERPRHLWRIGTLGWCDCGNPANYQKDSFNLCATCAEE